MTTDNRSREEILSENATLKLRLEEAEETLHAIQSGDVDALVVSTVEGDQVFTLKGAEHPYRILVETMSEGAALLDTDGMIVYCNRQLSELLQVTMGKLTGSFLYDYVASEDQALVADRVGNFKQQGIRDEITLKTAVGHCLPVLFSCGVVELAGKPGIGVVVTDISDRKHAETELKSSWIAADAANLAKSIFLANMSHEIRTPMNAIIGFAYLLKGKLKEPDQKDKLDKIISSSQHLLRIINEILDLSKIESGRLVLEETPFKIAVALNHAISVVSEQADRKGLTLIEDIAPCLADLTLLGDPLRLGQVLINLLGNAIKFTDHGVITLRAQVISNESRQLKLYVEVQDTGIGVSETQQNNLFTPFGQAEISTTRKYGGTGLGLAISKGIVHSMGGEIGMASQPGKGSTFWFNAYFKLIDSNDLQRKDAVATGGQLTGKIRILLVEDNEINQELAKEILEDFGFIVDIANHGGEAVENIVKEHYDLVLMDLQMPVMDGLEATCRIRKLPGCQDIPIIATR